MTIPSTLSRVRKGTDATLKSDLRTLVTFVRIYCRGKHHESRQRVSFKGFDAQDLSRKPLVLCPACSKLLHHGLIKRSHCRQDPKPACKDCPTPCYDKAYRVKIREVMRFSGWRLLLRGRLDLLFHLLRRPAQKAHPAGVPRSQVQELPCSNLTFADGQLAAKREK